MSKLAEYLSFAKSHPDLFVNPPQGGFKILLEEDEIHEVETLMKQRLKEKGLPTEWAQVGIAYKGPWGLMLRDAVRFPDGSPGTYYRFVSMERNTPRVVILPHYQGYILLIRRFRYATRSWHFEIPRIPGMRGISGDESARRELRENIGATPLRLISLGQMEAGPNIVSDRAEIFYADIESYGNTDKHKGIIEFLLVEISEIERMIRESEITDLFTIIAYGHAKFRGLL